jgi:hypothetical protein
MFEIKLIDFKKINERRFIKLKKRHKKFNCKQSLEEFNLAFKKGRRWLIGPDLPIHEPRKKYKQTLERLLSYLNLNKEEKIKEAIQRIECQFSPQISFYEHNIKKLDCLIYLEEKCDMIFKPDS